MYGQMTAGGRGSTSARRAFCRARTKRSRRSRARHFGGSLAGRAGRHRGSRRHGRRAAAGRDDERRRRARGRGRSAPHRAAAGDPLRRRGHRRPRRRDRTVSSAWTARGRGHARSRLHANAADVLPGAAWRAASSRTSSPIRRRRTTRSTATCRTDCPRRRRSRCARADPDEYMQRSMQAMARARRAPCSRCRRAVRSRSTTATTSARRRVTAGVDRRLRHSRLRARIHPPAVLRRQGTVPLGGAVRRARRTSPSPTIWRSRCSPHDEALCRWIRLARRTRRVPGAAGARSAGSASASARRFGLAINDLVRRGKVAAPIVIGRDHLDTGSVASPNRETEACATAATPSPTGPSSTRCSTPRAAPAGSRCTTAAASASAIPFTPAWWSSPTATREADEKLARVLTERSRAWASSGMPTRATRPRLPPRPRHGLRIPMIGRSPS